MHILHLDSGRTLRGGQRQLLLLMKRLDERGHSQTLLAKGATFEQREGIPATPLHLVSAARHVDLIPAHSGRAHALAVLFGLGRPLVVSRRVAFPVRQGWVSALKYKRARHYIAVSEFVQEQLLRGGIPREKVSVVYDAVAAEEFQTAAPLPSAEPLGRALRVVAPKVDDPLKRAPLLLSACTAAGADLTFSGDLQRDLADADIFAYLSDSEGLGSAILLAMAHKKPVLASRVGGILEIVEHESTGLLVRNETADIAASLRRFAADRRLARDCAERAFRLVGERFTDDIMVRQTEQIYQTVLSVSPSS